MKRAEGELVGSIAVGGGIAVVGYVVLAAKLGIAFAIPIGVVGLIASGVAMLGPLGKAIARRLDAGSPPDAAALEEATAPLVAHIDELRDRMAELEERVDFAERLLTQQREADRIGPRQGA